MECSVPFSLLEPHHCELTGNIFNNEKSVVPSTSTSTTASTSQQQPTTPTTSAKRQRKEEKQKQKEREKRARKEAVTVVSEDQDHPMSNSSVKEEQQEEAAPKTNGSLPPSTSALTNNEPTAMEQIANTEISPDNVIVLKGHTSEVFSCAWNPVTTSLLASGSGDATARLWTVPETQDSVTQPYLLQHLPNLNDNKDVTTLDWNVSLLVAIN